MDMFTISYLIHQILIPLMHFSRKIPFLLPLLHDSFLYLWRKSTDYLDLATRIALPKALPMLALTKHPSCCNTELSVPGIQISWYSCLQPRHYVWILSFLPAHLCVSNSFDRLVSHSCGVLKILSGSLDRCLNQTDGFLCEEQIRNRSCILLHLDNFRYKSYLNLDY